MYSLDEAQKGIGSKPPNQKEVQKVIFTIYSKLYDSFLNQFILSWKVKYAKQKKTWINLNKNSTNLVQQSN